MRVLESILAWLSAYWLHLSLARVSPPHIGDEYGGEPDAIEAEERQLRLLMSHWV